MEEIRDENSKTVFYRTGRIPEMKKYAWILLTIALIAGIIVLWGKIGSGARAALSDAKDIRVAMKLVSIEYYGGDGSIYDSSSENGMKKGALEKIQNISRTKGDLVLNSWDSDNNIPLSFTYRTGKYLVEYKEAGGGGGSYGMNGSWSVYYDFKILKYTTGD